ncbi:MAG: hypothetical protein WC741_01120 [Patescibacteria group bacterium]|jgi:hypothetical protein
MPFKVVGQGSASFKKGINSLFYRSSIEVTGEKIAPNWLKKSSFYLLAVPFIGGGYAVYEMIFQGAGREQFLPSCGASLGLLATAIGIVAKKYLNKK